MNITDNLLAPQHQQCILSIIFSNNAGQSDPLIHTLSTLQTTTSKLTTHCIDLVTSSYVSHTKFFWWNNNNTYI